MSESKPAQSPVLIDNPEAYTSRQTPVYDRLSSVEEFEEKSKTFTKSQEELVKRETRLFGIDPIANPSAFLEAHTALITDAELDMQDKLPRVKENVVSRIADYFGKGDKTVAASLRELMEKRLVATTQVGVYDSLAYAKDMGGYFSSFNRQPQLTISEIALALETSVDREEYDRMVEEVVLAHEVMHGVLTAGTQNTAFSEYWPIRNGLSVSDHSNTEDFMDNKITNQGEWVNEATLESFRKDIFQTEDVRYEPGVMIIEALDELSPGLRDELVLAALDATGPGPVFGKIELLLGPTGIEEVAELLIGVNKLEDLSALRASIVEMLPESLRRKGADILVKKEMEIFGNRQRYKDEMAKLVAPLVEAAIGSPLK